MKLCKYDSFSDLPKINNSHKNLLIPAISRKKKVSRKTS